jgi:hypothetical protein
MFAWAYAGALVSGAPAAAGTTSPIEALVLLSTSAS